MCLVLLALLRIQVFPIRPVKSDIEPVQMGCLESVREQITGGKSCQSLPLKKALAPTNNAARVRPIFAKSMAQAFVSTSKATSTIAAIATSLVLLESFARRERVWITARPGKILVVRAVSISNRMCATVVDAINPAKMQTPVLMVNAAARACSPITAMACVKTLPQITKTAVLAATNVTPENSVPQVAAMITVLLDKTPARAVVSISKPTPSTAVLAVSCVRAEKPVSTVNANAAASCPMIAMEPAATVLLTSTTAELVTTAVPTERSVLTANVWTTAQLDKLRVAAHASIRNLTQPIVVLVVFAALAERSAKTVNVFVMLQALYPTIAKGFAKTSSLTTSIVALVVTNALLESSVLTADAMTTAPKERVLVQIPARTSLLTSTIAANADAVAQAVRSALTVNASVTLQAPSTPIAAAFVKISNRISPTVGSVAVPVLLDKSVQTEIAPTTVPLDKLPVREVALTSPPATSIADLVEQLALEQANVATELAETLR